MKLVINKSCNVSIIVILLCSIPPCRAKNTENHNLQNQSIYKPKCYKIKKISVTDIQNQSAKELPTAKKEPIKIIAKKEISNPPAIEQKKETIYKESQQKQTPKIVQTSIPKEQKTQLTQVAEKKAEKVRPKQKPITISNIIDVDSLTYKKHWYKPSPSTCAVMVNNQEIIAIEEGKDPKIAQQFNVDAQQNRITAQYRWKIEKFGKIWHEEKKEIQFELLPIDAKKTRTLSFDWETNERLLLSDAKIISCKSIS